MDADGQRVAEYSEVEWFELYCTNGGKISAVERHIASLPTEQRVGYPSRATLYRYEADYQWQNRYAKIREGVKQDLKGDAGMNSIHINQLSALVMAGTMKRLHKAYEAGNFDAFTPRLLDAVWKMQRVERGLATNVPYERQTSDDLDFQVTPIATENLKRMRENLDKLTPEQLRILATTLAVPEPPAILAKK